MVQVDIENIIASARISQGFDLQKIAESIEGAEYNPDRFPGVILRFESPRIVVLIFEKGRFMCTGGRSVEDVQTVMDNIYDTLKELDLLGEPYVEKAEKGKAEEPKAGEEKPVEEQKPADEIDVGMTSLPPEVEAELIARGDGPGVKAPAKKDEKKDAEK